jgi:hypothetical protein
MTSAANALGEPASHVMITPSTMRAEIAALRHVNVDPSPKQKSPTPRFALPVSATIC